MTRLEQANNVADLRLLARRRLPRPIFDYIDGGADDEVSLRRNVTAFADYELVPDVLNDVSAIRTETRIFGQPARWPLLLSPTGLTRMFHGHAELAVARAAARHGLPYSLSTMGTTRLEDLAQAFAGPKVFQIYIFKDRGLTAEFVARCREAGFHGLALTVDTPVAGNRERDRVSGLSLPPKLTLKSLLSFALHPSWSLPALAGSRFDLANVSHKVDVLASGPMSLFDYIGGQFDRSVGWRDVEWLAREWNGPLAIKGVMTPEDARRSIDSGATGVIISNHGGRQLDGAPAPVDQIEAVRDAVGDGPDVICDGGIRRGSDVVKALALGATACSIGRPYLYGLAAAGEAGVDRLLTLLSEEFDRTLTLAGINDVAALSAVTSAIGCGGRAPRLENRPPATGDRHRHSCRHSHWRREWRPGVGRFHLQQSDLNEDADPSCRHGHLTFGITGPDDYIVVLGRARQAHLTQRLQLWSIGER